LSSPNHVKQTKGQRGFYLDPLGAVGYKYSGATPTVETQPPQKTVEIFQPFRHYSAMEHLSDTGLEGYYLGMIPDGPPLLQRLFLAPLGDGQDVVSRILGPESYDAIRGPPERNCQIRFIGC
jgi:hypothetical protein